jgi:hypothetical protein
MALEWNLIVVRLIDMIKYVDRLKMGNNITGLNYLMNIID